MNGGPHGRTKPRRSTRVRDDEAREMVRVTKEGGRIVMAKWIPDHPSFVSQLLKIISSFVPPPPAGFVSPMTWGVDTHIMERFGEAGVPVGRVSLTEDTATLSEADWQTRLPKDGRKVGVVVQFVASMYPLEIQLAKLVAAGQPITDVTWEAVAAINPRPRGSE